MTFEELKEKALSLPLKPGVYLMMDQAGTVIYVGKAKALKNRVSQYFHDQASHTEKTRAMVAQIDHFDTIVAGSEFEALVLENSLIKRHKPRYNILLKDDKGYPYIRLPVKEAYPRFSLQGRIADDGARYFGPFGGRHDTQTILDALRVALKLPSCGKKFPRDQGKERPCLNYHMGQCDGYCRREVPQSQHRQAIDQAVRLLEGKFGEVEKDLRSQMEQAAENLEFEKAAALRDRLRAITLLGKRQKVVAGYLADTDVLGLYTGEVRSAVAVLHFREGELAGRDLELFPTAGEEAEEILSAFLVQYYGARGLLPRQILLPEELEGGADISRLLSHQAGRKVELVTPQRGAKADLIRMARENAQTECERVTTGAERTAKILTLLAEKLELPAPPRRIEAYDISNTGASDIVAAMTVFEEGKPRKGAYRYFKLRDLDGPDDYASMDQVITRRFRHEKEGDEDFARRPDLLLIDGGATHAEVARKALRQYGLEIPIFGMVKDDRHRTRALVSPQGQEIGIQAVPALFAFIGQIQEETHRSAVGYHHKSHSKSGLGSTLEKIPGIGESRRKKLLKSFGSVKAIKAADLQELEAVLPKQAAQAVYHYFRPTGETQ
ncbi:MAG: excinuclease ABC subunit UvrC [Clostridiales bacterium]|nr:excinuclease ABC subunit UvrC [Clostridiales bacterium]MDY4171595.1 excinuclease ABC subunit UvrC [Evtepia sp.]